MAFVWHLRQPVPGKVRRNRLVAGGRRKGGIGREQAAVAATAMHEDQGRCRFWPSHAVEMYCETPYGEPFLGGHVRGIEAHRHGTSETYFKRLLSSLPT